MKLRLETICIFLMLCSAVAADDSAQRLRLYADVQARSQEVRIGVRKPFTATLVAERDAEAPQVSTVAFKLDVPDGIVIVGEELLVQSLVAIGTPRGGMHLAFHCVEAAQVPVYRFKMVAMRPLDGVVLRTQPVVIEDQEGRYEFLGIAACGDETYANWPCAPAALTIHAR